MPKCGASKENSFDVKQSANGMSFEMKKGIRMAYKCPCDKDTENIDIENSIGRYSYFEGINFADQQLSKIEEVSNVKDVFSAHIECPWKAFEDPVWKEVSYYLSLKEIQGTENINDLTDNFVFEAVMFYLNIHARIDNHILTKENEKRTSELKKAREASQRKHAR